MLNLMFALVDMSKEVAPFFIVFGGAVPYIPQYLEIKRKQNSSGFSTYVCLAILISNILRIGFWFGQPYPTPLLIQAILMNGLMLLMLHVCIRHRTVNIGLSFDGADEDAKAARHHILDWHHFWQWPYFSHYLQFILLFIGFTGLLTFVFSSSFLFVQSLGFIALLTEAMLGAPQFYKNYQKASTSGMSLEMVTLWTVGDILKTVYFVYSKAPLQFPICGLLQIGIDAAIFGQYLYYSRRKHQPIS